jgi:hypothetical protein
MAANGDFRWPPYGEISMVAVTEPFGAGSASELHSERGWQGRTS